LLLKLLTLWQLPLELGLSTPLLTKTRVNKQKTWHADILLLLFLHFPLHNSPLFLTEKLNRHLETLNQPIRKLQCGKRKIKKAIGGRKESGKIV